MQGVNRHDNFLRQRPGKTATNPDLKAARTHMMLVGATARTIPAAEHRVARDSFSAPIRRHPGSELGNGSGPLMARAQRITGVPGVQLVHIAGPKLFIVSAHPR